ncbi:MAG: FliH/SctL family protein [Pseudomonadota bacterium]
MATKYEKFELEELPKSAVINSLIHTRDNEVDEIINEAVSEHLSKIVDEEDDKTEKSSELDKKSVDDSLESRNMSPEDNSPKNEVEVEVDVEAIKEEFYQKGLEEAKVKYEAIISENSSNSDLSEKLSQKLSLISQNIDIDSQVTKISAEAISGIAKKLHLILPANFEEIISNGLIEKLKSFYKDGSIVLTIHPDRYDFCTEVLQSDAIPSKFKENFQIVKDDKLGLDDCILDYDETRLEYNQEQLTAEIDKIIEQLKSAR